MNIWYFIFNFNLLLEEGWRNIFERVIRVIQTLVFKVLDTFQKHFHNLKLPKTHIFY